ncbi:hypothetical protein [Mesorhizobium sp.]|uniref:hypothetical protein n=1 Tax=Mesorhizobium sp. TaxID=1871066 RepID=UPI001219E659|nr:hypothetical protein [Mesorhizobium sp.]TIS53314.1 MAG: hypothetical protein E5W91_31515 [Mesorhizobium sp.]
MTLSDIDRPAFEKRFFERTDAEKIGEERNGAQVSSVYILIAGNRKQLVHLMSASSTDTQSMFIASSIAAD